MPATNGIPGGEEIPDEDNYDGYLQLENGVGMIRLLLENLKIPCGSFEKAARWSAGITESGKFLQ